MRTNDWEMKSVPAGSPGWQEASLNLVQSQEDFLVIGFSKTDSTFLKRLCHGHHYRKFTVEKGLLFLWGAWS